MTADVDIGGVEIPAHRSRPSCWLFDLDNVLYPASCNLFDQVADRMTAYVALNVGLKQDEALVLRQQLFRSHGTTLNGLMQLHDVDPDDYLAFVHDVDISLLTPDHDLARRIAALPGTKIIFTNADADYAMRILERRGFAGLFDGIHDIRTSLFEPKPARNAYERLISDQAIDPSETLFIEDVAANLRPAKALGMQTGWVVTGESWAGGTPAEKPSYVDHMASTLEDVLTAFGG